MGVAAWVAVLHWTYKNQPRFLKQNKNKKKPDQETKFKPPNTSKINA